MMERRIGRRLQPVAARRRRMWLSVGWASCWLAVAASAVVVTWLARRYDWGGWSAACALLVLTLVLSATVAWFVIRRSRDYRELARRLEVAFPDLNARLLTAMEQTTPDPVGNYSFLQETVIREALAHDTRHDWRRLVPASRLWGAYATSAACLSLLAATLGRLALVLPSAAHGAGPAAAATGPEAAVVVRPGHTELERGTSLLVTAEFPRNAAPTEVTLITRTATGERRAAMRQSLDDPLFGLRLEDVAADVRYQVEYGGVLTEEFLVTVFEYPRLERADFRLVYPGYTGLEEKTITDAQRVAAVEGTQLTVMCHVNAELADARLVEDGQPPLILAAHPEQRRVYQATIPVRRSVTYQLHLRDMQGRTHKEPAAELQVEAVPNRPADLKWAAPVRDLRVSPLEEVPLAGNVWDDFGVLRYGVSFGLAGREPIEVVLGDGNLGRERQAFAHLVDFEALGAQPDQLASLFLWAEDMGPDGAVRRTESDMYFAEVRHFEELFREGQSSDSGEGSQQGAGQESEQLAELQKQIMLGTWKLLRASRQDAAPPSLRADAQLLLESQASALGMLEQLGQQLQDAEAAAHQRAAGEWMQEAQRYLRQVADEGQANVLPQALAAEQAAYQELLNLRAREHQVVQGQPSSSSSASGGASLSQQQLDELELKNTDNRYETERAATPPEDPAQREVRQALSRLRELARRQEDLNQRLQELQSALEQAQSEEERRELERQLQRLRDEQQEILRDTDELQQRLERPENRERTQDQRQQLANTRENVRRASQALEAGQTSQALTAGTRAERQFQQMQEELRRQAGGQFAEQAQQLKSAAERLASEQDRLAERLAKLMEQESRSLREAPERRALREKLDEQREGLNELLAGIRETVEAAEQDEPLLARKLYEAHRAAQQNDPARALQQAGDWLDQGFPEQAQAPAQAAGQSLNQLAEQVDEAAESVLGSEAESLQRARDELAQLASELGQELDRQAPVSTGRTDDGTVPPRAQGPQTPDQPESPSTAPETPPGQSGDRPATDTTAGSQRQPGSESPAGSEGQPASAGPARPDGQSAAGEQAGSPTGPGGLAELFSEGDRAVAPLTGDDYSAWSDRLRDVEELLSDPQLRADTARVREAARGVRIDWKRHSRTPNWDLVREQIQQPLLELRTRLEDELRRLAGDDELAPIDRDPVPAQFEEQVRRYYERLGSGRP